VTASSAARARFPTDSTAAGWTWAALRAWDDSWLGSAARSIWMGDGLGLLGLVLLVVFDAWAWNVSGSGTAAVVSLGLTLAVIAFSPTGGLYAVLAVVPFVPDVPALALVGALVLAALSRRLVSAKWRLRHFATRLAADLPKRLPLPIIVLGALLVIATVTSISLTGSLKYLAVWSLALGLYWVAADTVVDSRTLVRAAVALGLSAAFGGLHALYQVAAHVPVHEAWIDSDLFPRVGTRVFSFWGNPNIFALHLLLTGPVLAAALWTTRDRLARAMVGLLVLLAGLGVILTLSRAGWVGLGAAVLFLGLFRDKRILVVGALAVGAAVLMAPEVIVSRAATLLRLDDPTFVHRVRVWQACWRMVKDFWYSGLGLSWRAFTAVYPQYAIQGRFAFHAHSHYLETIIELGIIGFGVLHWIILTPVARVVATARRLRETTAGSVLVAAAAAVVGALTFGLAEPIFYLPRLIILTWAVLGLAAAACARLCEEDADSAVACLSGPDNAATRSDGGTASRVDSNHA